MKTIAPIAWDPVAARCLGHMLAQSWPNLLTPFNGDNSSPYGITRHFRWSIGAIVEAGLPPRYGRFGNCSPVGRCVGCEDGCNNGSLATELGKSDDSDALLLIQGGVADTQEWARVDVFIAGAPSLSGVAVPLIDAAGQLLLAFPEGGFGLVPDRTGVRLCKLWQDNTALGHQAFQFRNRLVMMRRHLRALELIDCGC